MDEKADHPHQAAVHLIKALRCCKDCYSVSEVDYAEIGQLQYEKDLLAKQLSDLGNPEQDLDRIQNEIHDLQYLILKVKQQNEIAYQTGMRQVQSMIHERQLFERQKSQGISIQLVAQRERNQALNVEIERVMERIRYLHRINQELVNKFCYF